MAKQAKSDFSKERRSKLIETCKQCEGAPETDTFNLQGMKGYYCVQCMNVVSWQREGAPIKIKDKVVALQDTSKGRVEQIVIEGERIPGLDFGKLIIKQ